MKKNNGGKISNFFKKYWAAILALILTFAVTLSSVEIYREEVLNIDPDIEYEEQNTLYLPSEEIDTLNPVISQSEDVYYLSKLIYSSLFTFDENLGIEPGLVSEYSINTDRAFVEITLKKGVKWHDGKTLKASDVAFTVNTMKAAGKSCPYYDKVKKINSSYAKSASVVMIYFNNNYNCSLDDLTFPIVSSSQYSSSGAFIAAVDGFKPVGTGQYKYKSYSKKKQLRLVPNEEYYGERAEKNITVTLLPERDLAANVMEIDSVTCYVDSAANRKSIALDREYKIYDIPSSDVEFIVLNTEGKYLSRKEMRQAVAYAVDTESILEKAYMGDGILTDTIYYPDFLGVKDTLQEYSRDVTKAEDILSSLGFIDRNSDGYREDNSDKNISLRILVKKSNATRNAAAVLIKKNLDAAGIDSEIISLPKSEYLNAIKNKEFDLLITGYTIEESYDLRSFFNGRSEWGYYNYDLFMKARELERLYTPDEYREKYSQLKAALLEQLPYLPLCYKKMSLIGVSTFEAEFLPMFNNVYKNCATWSWSIIKEKNNDDKD